MDRRLILPLRIDTTLHTHSDNPPGNTTMDAQHEIPRSPLHGRRRSVSEMRISAPLYVQVNSVVPRSTTSNIDDTEASQGTEDTSFMPNPENVFNDFCRGQPPRRSFLPLGRTPPRLRMSRRSTLADKPELDELFIEAMVEFRGKKFLPITTDTMRHLTRYVNGSKPLAHPSLFKRLLLNTDTNEVPADLFVAVLEGIGLYCEHLAVIAPFHTIEFVDKSDREVGNPEPGSDWDKILGCLPNLRKLRFEDPDKESNTRTRDTFYSLNYALAECKTFKEHVKADLDVEPELVFDFRREFRREFRRHERKISSPLVIVSSGVVYADSTADPEGPDSPDEEFMLGKLDGIDSADGRTEKS